MSKINETNYPRRTQANYADTDMLVIQAAGGNTYTTRLEDMREDYKETLAPILSALQDDVNENLATIEGSTASKAYAKGDFLVFGGRLCKAKTSIASGATLVLDTNIELDSVGDELSSISSDLTSVNGLLNGFHFLTTDKGPSGNQSVDSIRLWCKENGAVYNLGAYYTWVFNGWYWSQVLICNKIIAPTYAQVIITNTQGIMFTTTTQLNQQTPTWDTKTIAFS